MAGAWPGQDAPVGGDRLVRFFRLAKLLPAAHCCLSMLCKTCLPFRFRRCPMVICACPAQHATLAPHTSAS